MAAAVASDVSERDGLEGIVLAWADHAPF